MKKKLMCLLLVLLITSGCNKETSKTIICTKNSKMEENDIVQRVEANFINNKLTSSDLEIKLVISERYIQYIDLLEEQLLNSYNEFNNKDGITLSTVKETDNIKLKISINFTKLIEPIESLGLINDQSSSEDVYYSFSSMGYTCVNK